MTWTSADAELPAGTVGQVLCVHDDGDVEVINGHQALRRTHSTPIGHRPYQLKCASADNASRAGFLTVHLFCQVVFPTRAGEGVFTFAGGRLALAGAAAEREASKKITAPARGRTLQVRRSFVIANWEALLVKSLRFRGSSDQYRGWLRYNRPATGDDRWEFMNIPTPR